MGDIISNQLIWFETVDSILECVYRGLTPKGHRQQGEHHSHDLRKQVSSQFSADPPIDPLYQTVEPDLV